MDADEIGHRFGELGAGMRHLREKIDDLTAKVEDHIATEAIWRKRIDEQLSIGRFMWLLIKGVGLTIALLLTFKIGDIAALWKALLR